VTWRYSGDYCGWAPLPPRAVFREGVGFFYNGAGVSVGFDFGLNVGAFTFVHTRDFCDPRPWRHRVESREATQIFNRATVINNFDVDRRNRNFINHGIEPERITAVTRREIHPIAIRETTTRAARGEQLGRDGRTLMVNRPHFTDNPSPSMNRGESPRNPPVARPGVGSPYQPPNNSRNDNAQPPRRNQPTAPTPGQPQSSRPTIGSPYQPPNNSRNDNAQPQRRNQPTAPTPGQPQSSQPTIGSPYQPPNNSRNDNAQPPRRNQPAPPTATPGQRQIPPATTPGSPGRNETTTPTGRSPSPGNRYAPVTPVQPQTPNYNSTDNRRYPSPRMQQPEQQSPRVNPGNSGGRVGAPVTPQVPANPPQADHLSPPAQQPQQPQQRNYGAPATPPSPPVRQPEANHVAPPVQQPAPVQPPQNNYISPRNQTPPSESRPNYSQPPAAGNQSHSAPQPSSPPAQSQRSGGNKNQNGQ
jgi:hypothetical protein